MHAMLLTGYGGFDKLEFRTDYPIPQPEHNEVLVKVGACGLNNTDINTRTGWYSKTVEAEVGTGASSGFNIEQSHGSGWGAQKLQFPRIQGADVAGVIVDVGNSNNTHRIGERVIIDPWILADGNWLDNQNSAYFGSECDGGFAQFTKVRSSNAIAINSSYNDTELATLPCALTTAENLVQRTALKPGETVVITGASGGVGSLAIQLCLLRGAKVITIASKGKASYLYDLGVSSVIDRNETDISGAIQEAANGTIDVALDVVGGQLFNPLIDNLTQGGRYSSSGTIAGTKVDFDLRQLIYKDLQFTGATIVPPGTMQRLIKLLESHQIKPLLAASFPLQQVVEAQQMFLKKQHVGNIVVIPEPV